LFANILPAAGYRNNSNAALIGAGTWGYYWSSTVNGDNSRTLQFNSTNVNPATSTNRAYGFSVRCVAELNKKDLSKEKLRIYIFSKVFQNQVENRLLEKTQFH